MRLHEDLETLLEIQDLRALRRQLASAGSTAFADIGDAEQAARLEERIAEREQRLSPPVRAAYQRLARRHERIVAPVLAGVCHGCFVHVPTSRSADRERHTEVRTCESCGRFLYYAD